MAYDFASASSQRLYMNVPTEIGSDAVPWWVFAHIYRDTSTSHATVAAVGGGGSVNWLRLRNINRTEAATWTGSSFRAANSGTHNDAQWHRVAASWPDADNRHSWLDGSKTSDSGTAAVSGATTISIGAEISSSYMDGKLAEVGIWIGEPLDSQVAALMKGYAPSFFLDGLFAYLPMRRDLEDRMGNVWTVSGTPTVSPHPGGIIYPKPPFISFPAASGPTEVSLAGSQPASTGALSVKYLISAAGNQPASTGAVTVVYNISTEGNQPAPSGALSIIYNISVEGSQPASTGAVTILYQITLAGNEPAKSGAVTRQQALNRSIAGNEPAKSGDVTILYLIALDGDQPASTGAVTTVYNIAVTGNQPAHSGALSILYMISVAGAQPASAGSLAAQQTLYRALTGNQPASAGSLNLLYLIAIAGSQPASTGALTVTTIGDYIRQITKRGIYDPDILNAGRYEPELASAGKYDPTITLEGEV